MENDRLKEEMRAVQARAAKDLIEAQKQAEEASEVSQRKHALEMKQAKEKLMIEQDELKSQLLKQA